MTRRSARPAAIASAIEQLLADPGYRNNVMRLRREFSNDDGPKRALDRVEQELASRGEQELAR
jgi:UDP:flavonoid glycosyltransferase YjiC (YdhE family)